MPRVHVACVRVHVESLSAKLADVASKSVKLDDVAADVITKV